VAWTDPIELPEVKTVSKALGCSVNDMLLAAVTGALHDYLRDKGEKTEGVEVRALVPVNLRGEGDGESLGNRFGIVAVELPVGLENPLARLNEVNRRMAALKNSLEPPVTLGLLTALGYAPQFVQNRLFDLLLSRASAVMTNVPGPQHPLYLAGAPIKQIMFWVPQSGDIGMGVSILSFNGHVQFGLMTDAAMVPDPQAIIDRFKPEFEQLLYYVLLEPWGEEAAAAPAARVGAEAVAVAPAAGRKAGKRKTGKPTAARSRSKAGPSRTARRNGGRRHPPS
jgi:WS/DGAT/MGAT family acyltransferase